MKDRYQETTHTRLAGIERNVRFLQRRQQIPKNHPIPGDGSDDAVIDSTENVGDTWGVHSAGPEPGGYVLTADGTGGSVWAGVDAGGAGIQYDVENVGDNLYVRTEGPPSNLGGENAAFALVDTGGGTLREGIEIKENGAGGIFIENVGDGALEDPGDTDTTGIWISNDGAGRLVIRTTGDAGLRILNDGDGLLQVHSTGAGGVELKSFGAPIVIDSGGGGVVIDGTPFP